MGGVVKSAVAGAAVAVALALSAVPGGSTPIRAGQYRPDPIPTTAPVVVAPQAGAGVGGAGSRGSLATTGAESRDLAVKGAALVVVGAGLVVARRRSQDRSTSAR